MKVVIHMVMKMPENTKGSSAKVIKDMERQIRRSNSAISQVSLKEVPDDFELPEYDD